MWETPARDRGTPRGSGAAGDALGGPPDASRPRNPWPRLLAFAFVVVASVALVGVCVVSFANPPDRALTVELAALNPGVPRFLPVTTMGADRDGNTYGAWVTLIEGPPGTPARPAAVLSKAPGATCHVAWEPTVEAGGRTGVFVDPCGPARYTVLGTTVAGSPPRDLDAFAARVEGTRVIVDVTEVRLGYCGEQRTTACSTPGGEARRSLPNDALPSDFGRE